MIKLSIEFNKIKIFIAIILSALAVYMQVKIGLNLKVVALIVAMMLLISIIKIELDNRFAWLWSTLAISASAAFSVLSVQYLLLDSYNFHYTQKKVWLLNILLVSIIYVILLLISRRLSLSCIIAHLFLILVGFADYYVYQFRGVEMTVLDISSAHLGLKVAQNYHFTLDTHGAYILLAAFAFVLFFSGIKVRFEKRLPLTIGSLAVAIALAAIVLFGAKDMEVNSWQLKGTFFNGYFLNQVLIIRDSRVSKPDGYSEKAIEEIASGYPERSSAYSQSDTDKPTIIAIMNESFSDLRILGEGLDTGIDIMPFYDSLRENTIKGWALSSVYGAKTPNSEWEFLTGNTMAFMPEGSIPYMQYINSDTNTLVTTLENEGYTTMAMHPYDPSGWKRYSVYPLFGFDEIYFEEEFDKSDIMREYISDLGMYKEIIEKYEARDKDKPLFMWNVTMQNHGGYGDVYEGFEQYVKSNTGMFDVDQFLQLMHESDKALEMLITYFESVEEPVEIIFFGDHQPRLGDDFYPFVTGKDMDDFDLKEKETIYTVPFFIWTNYDTDEQEVDMTSFNYLSTMALQRANIDLPVYNQFLAKVMEVIPAINSQGYYSKADQQYKTLDQAGGEEEKIISDYRILEYNAVFGKEKRNSYIFPFLKDE